MTCDFEATWLTDFKFEGLLLDFILHSYQLCRTASDGDKRKRSVMESIFGLISRTTCSTLGGSYNQARMATGKVAACNQRRRQWQMTQNWSYHNSNNE